jgi:hypothetical protein
MLDRLRRTAEGKGVQTACKAALATNLGPWRPPITASGELRDSVYRIQCRLDDST